MWQTVVQTVLKPFRSKKPPVVRAEDRRKLERIRILLTIVCQTADHPDPFRILTENMNVLGVKFVSPSQLLTGEVVNMNILLHSSFSNLICNGRVVWSERKLINGKAMFEGGIEFIALNRQDEQYLQKFIDRYRTDDMTFPESEYSKESPRRKHGSHLW